MVCILLNGVTNFKRENADDADDVKPGVRPGALEVARRGLGNASLNPKSAGRASDIGSPRIRDRW
jgi:hypothetical protein